MPDEPLSQPPDDLPPPPPKPVNLPTPDGFGDINRASNLSKDKAKAEKKKKKDRRHPKDPYQKLKSNRSCGCGSCLAMVVLLVVLPIGGTAYWINEQFKEFTTAQGYASVPVRTKNIIEAPVEKTAFIGGQVLYEPEVTQTEVAFIGGTWWLNGTFHEKVSFRGYQLVLEPGSQFLKGLDVQAARLDIGDAVINGEITGKFLLQKPADKD